MRPVASIISRSRMARTCFAAGRIDFACSESCSIDTYFGPIGMPRSTISAGSGWQKEPSTHCSTYEFN